LSLESSALRRLFPFSAITSGYGKLYLAKTAYAELKIFFRHFDLPHEREKEIFTRLGYIDCQHLAPWIRSEVLFGTGLMDEICPASTQFGITSPNRMIIYPDFAHENLPDMSDSIVTFMAEL
jgi:cephalosporin-C deacetylase